jgi:hypothetical protein
VSVELGERMASAAYRLSESPMAFRPPLVWNWLLSSKTVFWAEQKESVTELPVTPACGHDDE